MKNFLVPFFLMPLLFMHQAAFTDGGSITNNRFNNSLIGSNGSTGSVGPAGPVGPAFASSYGQLASSSQSINLDTADAWVAIPFNDFSLSSNMDGSITVPATITILQEGVYQINMSLYIASEDSSESTFNATTYTIGTSINGALPPVACGAVYAGDPGHFSLNFNTIRKFAANDDIQFYIQTSAVGGDPVYDNIVSLIQGYAYLVQIAD